MTKTTDLIRYNLRERGRKHRGQARNFNIPALVAHINSAAVQERVKHRDMLGYYGHWPRMVFGITPKEGGIIDGKVVHIEPAFVTTHLKAFDDGTIEHRTEFYDNGPGNAAHKLYLNKSGGWSSAIVESENAFYGFDYVFEPNFTHNRGYAVAMDSAGTLVTLDDVEAYYDSAMEVALLLDSVSASNEKLRDELARAHRSLLAMQASQLELETTLDRVLKRGAEPHILDSIPNAPQAPTLHGKTSALFDRAEEYAKTPAVERKPAVATFDETTTADITQALSFLRG